MSEARIDNMLDLLADERDRLQEEISGVKAAIQANCATSVLVGLLIPGQVFMAAAAAAACAFGNKPELQRRIRVVEGVVGDLGRLAQRVQLVDANDTAAVNKLEREVLAAVDVVQEVGIVDDILDAAAAAARRALNAIRTAAAVASGFGTLILAAVVVYGVAQVRRR